MLALNLPPEVTDTLRSFYTCEVTTVGAQGQPMTWPTLTYFDEANGQFFFAVSIAFPVKTQSARAYQAKRGAPWPPIPYAEIDRALAKDAKDVH